MRRTLALLGAAQAVLALVALSLSACSDETPPLKWREVSSGTFTGEGTERLDLGYLYLAGGVRLAWDLSGPDDARAVIRLSVAAPDQTAAQSTWVRSWKENFSAESDEALSLNVPEFGEYRVTLVQRLTSGASTGYSGDFTLYTRDID
jgi:hypothetical protein